MGSGSDSSSSLAPDAANAKVLDQEERLELERQIRKACSDGHLDSVRKLLDLKVSVSAANNSGSTPLHEAAFSGHVEVVDLLLNKGAKASELDCWGASALHHAAARGHEDVVCSLILHKADVNAMNHSALMALDLSKQKGHKLITSHLEEEALRRHKEQRKTSQVNFLMVLGFIALLGALLFVGYYLFYGLPPVDQDPL
eukprot:TRINITY_DN4642_c5_g1_i1.p1 TRINITY_DN4642_c5_g1~~TRINITY_DN4642_c5_g1_i1.p1  ORF type:complete len:199 (+),score=46.88 TRINITY_DN4642_c5_g1_i1:52-648(+)